jgi:16S rRNA (uracil1498-N3)-methyltransferase
MNVRRGAGNVCNRIEMRHRIHVSALAESVRVEGDEFHHAIRVVRARAGEEVELFDDAGRLARATIESVDRDHAIVRMLEELPSREASLALTLAMAIIQLEKFELVLQKATELGVRTIVPLVTDRIELSKERYAGKMERWQKILLEAVKQSGRSVAPVLEEPAAFEDVVAREGLKLFFDADAARAPHREAPAAATLFIGPEGGWSDEELRLARHHQCTFERLGPRRLRAETAAIAALAIVAARWGDI